MTTDEPQPPDATRPAQEPRGSSDANQDSRDSSTEKPQRPLLRVVRGDATAEEVAALLTVVAALGSGSGTPPRRPTPEWSAHHRAMRRTLPHGAGGWRSSGLPR